MAPVEPETPGRSRRNRRNGVEPRRRWIRWLTLLLGLVLLGWVLWQASWQELVRVLSRADPGLLVAAVAAGGVATALRCLRYAQLFPNPSRGAQVFGAFAYMRLLNLTMPLRSGEVASLGLLKSHGLSPPIAETLPGWLVLRLSDAVGLAAWLVPALVLASVPGVDSGAGGMVVLIGAGSLAAVAVLALVFRRVPSFLGGGWLQGRLEAFRDGWRHVHGFGRLTRVTVLAIGISAAMIGINALALKAFGTPLPWAECWLLSAVVLGVTMLPIHGPLGLGTLDASWLGLLRLYDVPAEQAVGIALGIRLLTLGIVLLDGAIGSLLLALGPGSESRPR